MERVNVWLRAFGVEKRLRANVMRETAFDATDHFKCKFFNRLQISDIDCGELPPIDHGTIVLAEQRTSFGVQATFTCHENYTLIGNENRTCELEGWTGKQPQCLVDWCPEPIPIAGGKVQLNGKRAGSTAMYECDAGYVLIGEPVSDYV